jgi:hypothetical protein
MLKALLIGLLIVPAASASEIATRNAGPTILAVNGNSAMIEWGSRSLVVANAVDARPFSSTVPQAHFQKTYERRIQGSCHRVYPKLWHLDKACRADDGSLWALQRWQRLIHDYGGTSSAEELEISHYTTLPEFVNVHWQARYNLPVLCGELQFKGAGVYGVSSSARGVPLDTYGRLVQIDALDSDYGRGWRRVNSFLTHAPDGSWCYLFANHGRGSGRHAKQYAITANGPGVTPVIRAYVEPPA